MSEAPELLSAQSAEQQQAWAAVNAALGRLSLAYGIHPDSLNEPACAAIEANDTAAGPPHLHGPHHAGVGVGGRPDGSWLASASCDVTVRVWNLHHGPGPGRAHLRSCRCGAGLGTRAARAWLGAVQEVLPVGSAHARDRPRGPVTRVLAGI
jgi:hypothetical protein